MKIICLSDSYLLAHTVSMAVCQRQSETLRKCQGWNLATGMVRSLLIPPLCDIGKVTQHSCATAHSLNMGIIIVSTLEDHRETFRNIALRALPGRQEVPIMMTAKTMDTQL